MLLKIDLDPESLSRLAELAVSERRPVALQAEVLILQGLGRWPVSTLPITGESPQVPAEASA